MSAMKWWGWGQEGVAFSHEDKPALRDFIRSAVSVDVVQHGKPAIGFDALEIPAGTLPDELRDALVAAVGAEHVSVDDADRVVHMRGKSLRDLVRTRRGDLGRLPDVIVRPADEDQVVAVLDAVLAADAVLIPFGGGTNISGSLEAPAEEERPVVSLDVTRLDRVLEIDAASRIARVQAGIYGPELERQLNVQGWTAGHFPDSFTHSTLGGWIATRSSGMQSDKYGDIADLTRAVRVVTPAGVVATRPVPSTSTGPSVREMILGSEGRLGVITEATIHVHRIPAERTILGYLFPDWPRALQAMKALAESEASPIVTRVSDAPETGFSFATRKRPALLDRVKSAALQQLLKRKHIDPHQMCLSFIGFEGSEGYVKQQRKLVAEVIKPFGGFCLGASPGELYDQKKFDTPYIRDFLLDRGALADVSETAAPWSRLAEVYDETTAAARAAIADLGIPGWVMCHMSHSYHSGACLYFTFAIKPSGTRDELEEYDAVKGAIQQAFVDHGATLSHHHAVGIEHARWLEQDISPAGVALVRGLLQATDPGANLNPGKVVTDAGAPAASSAD